MAVETLTDEERDHCSVVPGSIAAKALRIIDAHAAERAALEAQLEEAERNHRECLDGEAAEVSRWKDLAHDANAARTALDGRVRELVAQLEELRESLTAARCGDPSRCPACYASPGHHYGWAQAHDLPRLQDVAEIHALKSEVTRLTRERDEARVHVAELEAGNTELRRRIANQAQAHDLPRLQDVAEIHALKSEVTRLTEALAAAESRRSDANQIAVELEDKLEAAESECAALRADLAAKAAYAVWMRTAKDLGTKLDAAESECAALRAEVERLRDDATEQGKGVSTAGLDNLAGALACCRAWEPEARLIGNVRASTLLRLLERTEAEQRVLDAIRQAMRRLGDDPPYYECRPGDLDELGGQELYAAINAFTDELASREGK